MDREVPGFIANRLQEAQWREALHMIDQGEATVEQIDRSITDGPGLRWPFQGPMLTFHLAGGEGGMAHMLDHFGPSLKSPWTRLDAPELTQSLRDDVVAGCDAASGDMTIPDLIAGRDAGIIALRRLTAELGRAQTAVPQTTGNTDTSTAPIELDVFRTEVIDDWIDYNGHMSEAFYVLVFGFATDQVMDRIGLDEDCRRANKSSLYTVESHIRYLDEVPLGAVLEVAPKLVSAGSKKVHLAYEMRVDGTLVSTEEIIALHVDQTEGSTAPFPDEVIKRIERVRREVPDWVGRRLG
nr:thioesterase family protein [Brevibacterium marinum]